MDLFEAMHTQRAIRRYKPDPVPDEDITKILKATVHAPSGGNRQPWHFVVVRDAELRKKLGELYWGATEYARENLGLHKDTPTDIKYLDTKFLHAEAEVLMHGIDDWVDPALAKGIHIGPGWSPEHAEQYFLIRFQDAGGEL